MISSSGAVRQVAPAFFPFSNSIQFPPIRRYTVIVIWVGAASRGDGSMEGGAEVWELNGNKNESWTSGELQRASHVEANEHNISILHRILSSLHVEKSVFLDGGFGTEAIQVGILDDFRTDEPAFEIAVDHTRRFDCRRAFSDGPGMRLVRVHAEESYELQQVVAFADDLIQARFLQAELQEKRWPLSFGKLGDLCLHGCADHHDFG
jgi:hypothetical protein